MAIRGGIGVTYRRCIQLADLSSCKYDVSSNLYLFSFFYIIGRSQGRWSLCGCEASPDSFNNFNFNICVSPRLFRQLFMHILPRGRFLTILIAMCFDILYWKRWNFSTLLFGEKIIISNYWQDTRKAKCVPIQRMLSSRFFYFDSWLVRS